MLVLTGCQKPRDPIGKAEAAINSAALAAIVAKYPDVSSSELKFSGMTIRTIPNGQEEIWAEYVLPASEKTTTDGKSALTRIETIYVLMSRSGKVEKVIKDWSSTSYSVGK